MNHFNQWSILFRLTRQNEFILKISIKNSPQYKMCQIKALKFNTTNEKQKQIN